MKKHILILLAASLLACAPVDASQAGSFGEWLNAQAAARSNADIGQHNLKRKRYRYHYHRRINRPPKRTDDETVIATTRYSCRAVASFATPVDPYRYGDVDVSAWLSSVAPPTWKAEVSIVGADELNEIDLALLRRETAE